MRSYTVNRLFWPLFIFFVLLLTVLLTPYDFSALRDSAWDNFSVVLTATLAVMLGLAVAWLTVRCIDVFFWRVAELRLKTVIPRLIKDLVAIAVFLIVGITLAKVVFNQPVTAIWATSGILAFVLGMATRHIIADLFSGVALNVDQPFKIGDWVQIHERSIDPMRGCVTEISWRSTRIRTTRNTLVVVPNSVVSQMVLVNLSRPDPKSRFDLRLTFDFGVAPQRVVRILLAGTKAAHGILEDPEPKALVHQVNDNGTEYRIRYWLDPRRLSPRKARHRVLSSILEHLYQAGITPAYEKQDLFITRMPERQLDRDRDMEQLLRRADIFTSLESSERKTLAEKLLEKRFFAGDSIVKQGEPGQSMYILVEGLLGVYRDQKDEEAPVRLDQLIPGEFFGEMSLLTGEARTATVLAMTDAIVFEISKDVFCDLLEGRPEIAIQVARIVARREQGMSKKAVREDAMDDESIDSFADHILDKMKNFFGGLRDRLTVF